MAAAFELQFAIGAFALNAEDDLFEPAQLGRRHVQQFDLPAVVLGVMFVHLVEVASEEGRFFAAGAGADFQNATCAVGVLAADGHVEQIVPQRFPLGLELRKLGLGQLAHLEIIALGHLHGVANLPVELLEAAILRGQLVQRPVLAHHRRQSGRIGQHFRIDELSLQLFETGKLFVEWIGHDRSVRCGKPRGTPLRGLWGLRKAVSAGRPTGGR